jgi:hypothetical protein
MCGSEGGRESDGGEEGGCVFFYVIFSEWIGVGLLAKRERETSLNWEKSKERDGTHGALCLYARYSFTTQ